MKTVAKNDAIEAWHFLPEDRMTRYSPRELVTVGSILVVKHQPILCERGLHASVRAIDALRYAPGPIACRVRVWGDVVNGGDKLAGTHRECLGMVDATNTLHEFACCCAEAALLMADVTDARCWHVIEAKRAWLRRPHHLRRAAAWLYNSAALAMTRTLVQNLREEPS